MSDLSINNSNLNNQKRLNEPEFLTPETKEDIIGQELTSIYNNFLDELFGPAGKWEQALSNYPLLEDSLQDYFQEKDPKKPQKDMSKEIEKAVRAHNLSFETTDQPLNANNVALRNKVQNFLRAEKYMQVMVTPNNYFETVIFANLKTSSADGFENLFERFVRSLICMLPGLAVLRYKQTMASKPNDIALNSSLTLLLHDGAGETKSINQIAEANFLGQLTKLAIVEFYRGLPLQVSRSYIMLPGMNTIISSLVGLGISFAARFTKNLSTNYDNALKVHTISANPEEQADDVLRLIQSMTFGAGELD